MKILHILYLAEKFKWSIRLVYICTVTAIILPLLAFVSSTDSPHSQVSSLPVPGTYEASLVARHPPAQTVATHAAAHPHGASVWPLAGLLTTEFGASGWPYQRSHTGIDISSRQRSGVSNVVAFRAGQVFRPAGQFGGYGTFVAIDHGAGLTSYYGHLHTAAVQPGQQVRAGEAVGTEGSTGHSTGPHVHFEIRMNNIPVNPRNFLAGNP